MKHLLPILLLVFSVGVGADSRPVPIRTIYYSDGSYCSGQYFLDVVRDWRLGREYGLPKYVGTCTFSDGTKYGGGFKNGKFHGQGTFTWANGDKYVGQWKRNLEHGLGYLVRPDGTKYVGEYKYGKPWKGAECDKGNNVTSTYSDGLKKLANTKVDNSLCSWRCAYCNKKRSLTANHRWCLSGGKIKKQGQNSCRSRGGRVFESKDLAEQAKRDRQ
tara:strand:+ start:195 stop:842 length:648 start_codon:yes stop_codon:yes gene_type:complete